MRPQTDDNTRREEIPGRVQAALRVLLEASEYAQLTDADRWEFAVEMQELRKLGLSPNDLRFLVRMQLVEHAREVTIPGHNGRKFQLTGDLTFTKRTCFVLTDGGISAMRDAGGLSEKCVCQPSVHASDAESPPKCLPSWDVEKRLLCFQGRIVKKFKWHAVNQEKILEAFQEEGWPSRIDDPLPPQPAQDPKRRLSDTIKCLNRKQQNHLLLFHGDGSGEGVIWELVEQAGSHNYRA